MTPIRNDGDIAAELQEILHEAAGLSPAVNMGYPRFERVDSTNTSHYSYAVGGDTIAYRTVTGNEGSTNIGVGDQRIRFDNNELSFEDASLKITLEEILEMRNEIKKLHEEIEELKQWKEV